MRPAATSLLILCLAASGQVLAKSTDRSQPMDIDADRTDALLGDNAEGAAAARAELVRRIDRASVG